MQDFLKTLLKLLNTTCGELKTMPEFREKLNQTKGMKSFIK